MTSKTCPCNATCLIDGAGKIVTLALDSGAEPFMNVEFLIGEAIRLLHP